MNQNARVIPFVRRTPAPPPTATVGAYAVTLRKGTRQRLYQICAAGVSGIFQTWVRFDGKPHRAKLVATERERLELLAQFEREIAELERDGWQRT